MSHFEAFVANIPRLHSWDGGTTWNTGGFEERHLRAIHELVRRDFRTPRIVETGAGASTILFLLSQPSVVTTVCPEADLYQRIREYCQSSGVGVTELDDIVGFSQDALPKLVAEGRIYDFALIDGAHGWPLVMVDFCYLNAMLRSGGLLMIDDLQLHTVRELGNLLLEQPGFDRVADIGKSWIFRKTTNDAYLPEWNQQPYIVRKSS